GAMAAANRVEIPSDNRSGIASAADGCLPSNEEVDWACN
ncbi:hypothetical protein A2U01_0111480, partial [Trifolium medium]|nr:hypothetical protein [Trifolium medium]